MKEMNKEIDFRIWHKELKMHCFVLNIDLMREEINCNCAGEECDFNFDEVIIEQFTNNFDKNGTPIFEGDILEGYNHYVAEEKRKPFYVNVKYKNGSLVCAWNEKDDDGVIKEIYNYFASYHDKVFFEIIGNIHEGHILKEMKLYEN